MEFTVNVYQGGTGAYLCRLEFEFDNWLQRKARNGGAWRAVPGVLTISSGRFDYHQGYVLRRRHGSWLRLADTDSFLRQRMTGSKDVADLMDFDENPVLGTEGRGIFAGDARNRMVVWHFRWVVRSVNGKHRIFPSRNR